MTFNIDGVENSESIDFKDLGEGIYETVFKIPECNIDDSEDFCDGLMLFDGEYDNFIFCNDLSESLDACIIMSLERLGVDFFSDANVSIYMTKSELDSYISSLGIEVYFPRDADVNLLLDALENGEKSICYVSEAAINNKEISILPGLCDVCPVCIRGFDLSDSCSAAIIYDNPFAGTAMKRVKLSDFVRGWVSHKNQSVILRRKSDI